MTTAPHPYIKQLFGMLKQNLLENRDFIHNIETNGSQDAVPMLGWALKKKAKRAARNLLNKPIVSNPDEHKAYVPGFFNEYPMEGLDFNNLGWSMKQLQSEGNYRFIEKSRHNLKKLAVFGMAAVSNKFSGKYIR
jgi:hypothetical protein